MKWSIEHEGPFRGESTVRVKNRRGQIGIATVEYQPTCRVVGPVVEEVERDDWGLPVREPEVIDQHPTFA